VSDRPRLSHAYLTVTDLASARAFWSELVGLEMLIDGDEYLRLGGGGGFSVGMERTQEGVPPEVELVLRVDDVDAIHERLTAAGIDCSTPETMPWGARHIWLRDPDGHPVSIYSSSDEAK
jgi:catechol 2,3-dioxygenase-like lactoylglutathione lyase family enzyme